MKRILELFPHGVLIQTKSKRKAKRRVAFTNHEFQDQIQDIRDRLESLKDIQISFDKKEGGSLHKVSLDLHAYLKQHQRQLKKEKIIKQQRLSIRCKRRGDARRVADLHDTEGSEQERIFNIKTMKVNWEGESCFMHVFIDNTDIVKLEEANNSIRCQKIMFTSISHEFRTPLNAIMNSYKFIDETFGSLVRLMRARIEEQRGNNHELETYCDSVRRFVRMGSNSSVVLLGLIEDILDLSKFEAGTFSLNMSNFELRELVDEVIDIFAFQCQQKKLKLDLEFDFRLRAIRVRSDRNRLKQVLLNLMSNAFKFTFEGRISLGVALTKTQNAEMLEFEVTDSGIGITEKQQRKLFQLFSSISNEHGLSPHGCGIGLTISKKYVEKLGGTINLKSVYGEGTAVTFTIPLVRVYDESTEEAARVINREFTHNPEVV